MVAAPALARTTGPQTNAPSAGETFYDARFQDARAIALRLSPSAALTPVNGDISGNWVREFTYTAAKSPQTLRGVTTESFYFCLKTLLQPRGMSFARIERVSRDLHAWEIRITAPIQDGIA